MSDFPTLADGVYVVHSAKKVGDHAVRMLGWGTDYIEVATEEGGTETVAVPYFLCANSWGTAWGSSSSGKGYFKIRRGTNEAGIEQEIVAGIPQLKL